MSGLRLRMTSKSRLLAQFVRVKSPTESHRALWRVGTLIRGDEVLIAAASAVIPWEHSQGSATLESSPTSFLFHPRLTTYQCLAGLVLSVNFSLIPIQPKRCGHSLRTVASFRHDTDRDKWDLHPELGMIRTCSTTNHLNAFRTGDSDYGLTS